MVSFDGDIQASRPHDLDDFGVYGIPLFQETPFGDEAKPAEPAKAHG